MNAPAPSGRSRCPIRCLADDAELGRRLAELGRERSEPTHVTETAKLCTHYAHMTHATARVCTEQSDFDCREVCKNIVEIWRLPKNLRHKSTQVSSKGI